MKPLTSKQAVACENAALPRCNCRCHGELHGTGRSRIAEYFEQLPDEDPHWLPQRSRQMPLPPPVGWVA